MEDANNKIKLEQSKMLQTTPTNNFSEHIMFTYTNNIFDDDTTSSNTNNNYLGFTDIIGFQDYHNNNQGPNSLFDLISNNNNHHQVEVQDHSVHLGTLDPSPSISCNTNLGGELSCEVVHTPNSISVSSSSCDENLNHDHHHDDDHKLMKEKSDSDKIIVEVDEHHDEDDKSKKQSYYRCTTAECGVKKRVERSSDDSTIVVTTYEGQHTHPCPVMTRAGFGIGMGMGMIPIPTHLNQCNTSPVRTSAVFGGTGAASSSLLLPHLRNYHSNNLYHHQQQQYSNYLLNPSQPSLRFSHSSRGGGNDGNDNNNGNSNGKGDDNDQQYDSLDIHNLQRNIGPCSSSLLNHVRDDGLLQDIVPSQMRNNDQLPKEE